MKLRSRVSRLEMVVRLVGPRPLMLVRTLFFITVRALRRHRLRRLYTEPLAPAAVKMGLPTIGLTQLEELPSELQGAAIRLREEADHVLRHQVDFLGSGLVNLGPVIDWHQDFKSAHRWPLSFYEELEVTRLDDRSDAKVPWELSRCHHLLTLARAARLFEEERYATELESQLAAWLDANPPGQGINWVNPMEIGIRVVNLVWAVATLEEWRPLSPALHGRLVASLRWHGRHIVANLEGTPYLRSNHYLGNLLGLLVLGAVLSGEPDAPKWFDFARGDFEREIIKQVHPDGVTFEASLAYHGLALEMFLIAKHVAAWAGVPFSARFNERLNRMGEVSRNVRHPNGRIPLFGDQDSGRILPEGFARTPSHDNLLWWLAALTGKRGPLVGPVHPEVAWTFGLDAWQRAENLAAASPVGSAAFPIGGIFVLRSARTHLVVRCGGVGQNGSGGHSHNDLLSYELSVDGVPLIVDSGTYAYTFDVPARNEFRSTRAHNTVVVDEQEIHPFDPRRVFELRQFAQPRVDACDLASDVLTFEGSHDGYRRLSDPVVHARRISLDTATGEVNIRDELAGAAAHGFESLVHLVPGTSVHRVDDVSFEIESERARARLSVTGVDGDELNVEEGWFSDRYGARERTLVVVARGRRSCPAVFGYALVPVPAQRLRSAAPSAASNRSRLAAHE
jgi:hypothetical protein